jgi:hypothetical protein
MPNYNVTQSDEIGDCYEVHATLQVTDGFLEVGEFKFPTVLVHAIVDPDGVDIGPHGHAWLEVEELGLCLDFSRGQELVIPRERYYELGGITDETWLKRYTSDETRMKMFSFRHYGPWEGPEACPPAPREV